MHIIRIEKREMCEKIEGYRGREGMVVGRGAGGPPGGGWTPEEGGPKGRRWRWKERQSRKGRSYTARKNF